MTCPGQSLTFTIPYPSGLATVVPIDSVTCNGLDATAVKVQVSASGAVLGLNTTPSVEADALGLHFAANGLSFGSSAVLLFTFLPANKTWQMTYSVGGSVSPAGSTTTP